MAVYVTDGDRDYYAGTPLPWGTIPTGKDSVMRWKTAVAAFDWLARLHFAGTLISGAISVIAGLGAYYQGWNWLSVLLAMIVTFAAVGIIYIAFCYFWDRHDTKGMIPRNNDAASAQFKEMTPLFEAATRAYGALEDKPYGIAVYGLADAPNDRLTWLCNAIFRPVDGKKPLAALYGSEPPSRVLRELMMEVYNNYDFHIESETITLHSRYGDSGFQNLCVRTNELAAAINDLASREV